jgi:hypothetical protein
VWLIIPGTFFEQRFLTETPVRFVKRAWRAHRVPGAMITVDAILDSPRMGAAGSSPFVIGGRSAKRMRPATRQISPKCGLRLYTIEASHRNSYFRTVTKNDRSHK